MRHTRHAADSCDAVIDSTTYIYVHHYDYSIYATVAPTTAVALYVNPRIEGDSVNLHRLHEGESSAMSSSSASPGAAPRASAPHASDPVLSLYSLDRDTEFTMPT